MQDFFDEAEIKRVYYPEMEALIKAESGAKRVVVFDHTLRTADDELREKTKIREVVRRVHNDYTEWSGPQRVRDMLPDEADDLLTRPLRDHPGRGGRSAIRSRPIRSAIATRAASTRRTSSSPSALSQPRRPDLRGRATIRSTSGTGSRACGATRRWCSRCSIRPKDGRARWTAHTAFDDPTTPPNARPRESIEIRTLAFF